MQATDGARMLYLIKRKPETVREELVAHWFANHMPIVIEGQKAQRERGALHAWRYIATVFEAREGQAWDGVAALWWDKPLPQPERPFGDPPTDSFQAKAEPYLPWATREYVVMDPRSTLEERAPTTEPAYPNTRANFHKVTFLVTTKPGIDFEALFEHWLAIHVPNVRDVMEQVGGCGYVVSHSIDPQAAPYAGMAELYFPDRSDWDAYRDNIRADGMEQWVGNDTLVLHASMEMVGIP
ncbi:MAG: EthD domain-containing protein [Pseudomonadota bacterium]